MLTIIKTNGERRSDFMDRKIVEQAILNHAILNTVKLCKNKQDDSCDDCPFIDLKDTLEKEFSYE